MRLHRLLPLALLLAAPAAAQEAGERAVSLSAGARSYPGEGSKLAVALRAEYPLSPTFLLEAAGSVADPVGGDVISATSVFEVQAQNRFPGRRVTPYVGAGAGLVRISRFLSTREDRGLQPVATVGAGVRVTIERQIGVVADVRLRGGNGDGHYDATVGIRYLFR